MRGQTGGFVEDCVKGLRVHFDPHASGDLYTCGSVERSALASLEPATCNTPSVHVHLVCVMMVVLSMCLDI